ncbi:hypothetical protein PF010_g14699 [Phytophthora fragariae]|uniref:Uncharacterized protein n=1 Tax=Phytophthora fragariae TaxID=53985 RepID=A0A6G0NRA8_9STRA|nr:hypothetical protein PF010_g14699 [Phytophthora fragariae]KAE9218866.1 hypothetical protein PF004_g13763 [Phytophthora fragariae]
MVAYSFYRVVGQCCKEPNFSTKAGGVSHRDGVRWKSNNSPSSGSAVVLTRRTLDPIMAVPCELPICVQQFVHCRGSQASIYRIFWCAQERKCFAVNLTSRKWDARVFQELFPLPLVFRIVEEYLGDDEIDAVLGLSTPHLAPSGMTLQEGHENHPTTNWCTRNSYWLESSSHPVVQDIDKCQSATRSPPNVLKKVERSYKNRMITVFWYMQDVVTSSEDALKILLSNIANVGAVSTIAKFPL